MAFNFNGNTPKKILFNGQNVAKLIFNGVVVWLQKVLTTITGIPPLSLNNSTGDDIVDYKIYGNSVQDETPSLDNPIEIQSVGDKTRNLFDKNAVTLNSRLNTTGGVSTDTTELFTSDYIEVSPNTTYSTNVNVGSTWNIRTCEYNKNKGFVKVLAQSSTKTFTTGSTTKYIRFTASKDNLNNIMFIEGSTATSYEPYGYRIPVNVKGKNLFDNQMEQGDIPSSTGQNSTSNMCIRSKNYIKIEPDTNYFFEREGKLSDAVGIRFYNENKEYLSSNSISLSVNVKNKLFKSPNNAYYLRITDWTNDLNNTYLLAKSSTATSYEPYFNRTENIYLDEPLRKIGNYADYIDFENGKVVRNVTEIIFDENKSWEVSQASSNRFAVNFTEDIVTIPAASGASVGHSLCNLLQNEYLTWVDREDVFNEVGYVLNSKRLICRFGANSSINTLAKLKTFLASNPLKLYCELATPTEEAIELPIISTNEGTNIIDIDTEITPSNISVKYYSKEV